MKITGELETQEFLEGFKSLDKKLSQKVELLVGGGAAMILAHHYPLATFDVDAIPFQTEVEIGELDKYVKQIAKENKLPPTWLNPYFSNFTYVLPSDYQKRLIEIFTGKYLFVYALDKIDLLILKSFAGREKDVGHAKALMRNLNSKQLEFIEKYLEHLHQKSIPRSQEALDFYYDIKDALGK